MNQKGRRDWRGAWWLFVTVLAIQVLVGMALWWLLPAPRDWGSFSDAFGGIVGALFAGLAFAGILYTILQQHEALNIQRNDLELNRQELKETREELQRTANAQQRQVYIAQMAARLTATTSLLDSATQELASFDASSSNPTRHRAKAYVEDLRVDLKKQKDELEKVI